MQREYSISTVVGDQRPQPWPRAMYGSWFGAIMVVASVLSGVPQVVAASEIAVRAAISSQRPYVGDTVALQIRVVQSVQSLPEIESKGLDSLGFRQAGQPGVQHSRTTINGVSSESFTYLFTFEFTADRAGPMTIPAVTVRQGSETASTNPIQIEVVGAEEQDYAVVELAASDQSVYPGQNVTLTVAILLRRLWYDGELMEADPFSEREPPLLRIPWLEGTEILKPAPAMGAPPEFEKGMLAQRALEDGPSFLVNNLFARGNWSFFDSRPVQSAVRFDREKVERAGLDGQKQAYYRYKLPLEYRAVHAGSVGPLSLQLRGSVFTEVSRGPRGLEAGSRKVFAVAEPVTLTILPVPKAGQPSTFTGGVGMFRISSAAQPTKVRVGDPITLTVRISGHGNLEAVEAPDLTTHEKWQQNFKVHNDPSPGRLDGDSKTFTFSVRPKSEEVTEIPAIRLSYFNPKLEKYEDTYSDRIALQVDATERLNASDLADPNVIGTPRDELHEALSGLAANYTGPAVLDPQGPYQWTTATWSAMALSPPLLWCIALAWQRRVAFRRQNPGRFRAQAAYRRASKRLVGIAKADPDQVPHEVARTIAVYLADRLDLAAGELTPAEARSYAERLEVPPAVADQLTLLLEQCDRSRFGRGGDPVVAVELLRRAQQIVRQLEQSGSGAIPSRAVTVARAILLGFGAATVLGGLSGAAAGEIDRSACLARANAAFARGASASDPKIAQQSFLDAIADYERLRAAGTENGMLHYNLGNAHFRLGDVPRAILHYRLAERLMPRDELIAANLAFARSRVPERIEATPTSRLLGQLFIVYTAWNIRERMQAMVTVFVMAWFVLGIRIWIARRWLLSVGMVMLAVSASLAISICWQLQREREQPIGVLAADEVVVRTGDGETYEPQFTRPLRWGAEFCVLNRRRDWLLIRLADGKTGWIRVDQAVLEEVADDRTNGSV